MKVAMEAVSKIRAVHGAVLLTCPNESYLISRVHSYAQRATKIGDHLWCCRAHPLRWHLSAASFFDSYRLQSSSCQRSDLGPAEQLLHRRRIAACHPLPNHSWSRTDRDNTVAATQWCLSLPERTADLSQSQHPQTFLASHSTQALTRLRKLHDRLLAKMIAKPHL